MEITHVFKGTDGSQAVKDYATEKLSRIEKFLKPPVDIHVVFAVESKIRHLVEVTINSAGLVTHMQEAGGDMYSAIDLIVDRLEKQLSRYKEKLKDHRKTSRAFALSGGAAEEEEGMEAKPRIVPVEPHHYKPMTVEEAVLEMGLEKENFYVFTNCDTSRASVIFKRNDGDIGFISI